MDIIKLHHNITYNDPKLVEKFNVINEEEKEQLRDVIYKYDLLSIFGLDDFLEEIILEKMSNLYNIIIENAEIKNICSTISDSISTNGIFKKINENDNFEYFMVLFSYDHLHLFYPCICEFLEKGAISNEKITALKNNIIMHTN